MPTFLTTPKMSPELRARVEASVRGRRVERGKHGAVSVRAGSPLLVSLARAFAVAVVIALVCAVVLARRRDRRELEAARAALLASLAAKSATLTARDLSAVPRDEAWLVKLAGAYEGDVVASALRDPATLASTLARPGVYVRGPIGAFVAPAGPAGIAEASSASVKDPLLACLLDPPASRTEKTLLAKVRAAYGSGAAPVAPSVSRLAAAETGLRFFLPAWAASVRAAPEMDDVEKLGRDLSRAPLDEARRAMKAELLFAALDEPGDGSGPTELDGERAHFVRVAIVDLAAGEVLLRVRKHVDPSWISESKRPQYAAGLDGCALAMDVRDAAIGAVPFRSSRL